MSGPVPDDHLRVGTAERDATAKVLNLAFEAGRLTPEELDQRLEACFTAKTRSDLAGLTADLPEADSPPSESPRTALEARSNQAPRERPVPAHGPHKREATPRELWIPWAGVSALVVMIWFITAVAGGGSYFWPIWVIGPWGAVNLFVTIGLLAKPRDDENRSD